MSKIREEILLTGRRGDLYNLLKDNPDGMETEELLDNLKIVISSLYTLIYNINKSSPTIKIYSKNRKYYLKESSTKSKISAIAEASKPASTKNSFISPALISKLKQLPVNDINDVLDMYKKSYYYQKSAEALIEANRMINVLTDQLSY